MDERRQSKHEESFSIHSRRYLGFKTSTTPSCHELPALVTTFTHYTAQGYRLFLPTSLSASEIIAQPLSSYVRVKLPPSTGGLSRPLGSS